MVQHSILKHCCTLRGLTFGHSVVICWMVQQDLAKRVQHVVIGNNAAICCDEKLRTFGRMAFKQKVGNSNCSSTYCSFSLLPVMSFLVRILLITVAAFSK